MPGGSIARTAVLAASFFVCASASADAQRALVPLTINHTDQGTRLAVLYGDDVFLRVHDLESAGMRGFGGRREQIDGEEFVSLASLGDDARYELDAQTVSLALTVPPAWLGGTVLDMSPQAPPGIVYSNDTSGFVNYAFNARGSGGSDAFLEGGLSVRGDLLFASASRASTGELARGLTSYTHDDRKHLRRWVAGDAFASAGGLGGSLFLGGLSVSRSFDLDPYFVRTPTMSLSGAVTTPSTIDVYVNGAIVRRQQIQPGTFDIKSLALPAGSGTARVVVRDAFGQERSLTNPFYASTQLLAQGLNEYAVHLGFRREQIATPDDDYGSPAFLAWQRHGWTDAFTSGVRFEADSGVASVGESLAARLPFGELEAEIAASRDGGAAGTAASVVFRRLGRSVNFGVFVRAQSGSYANLSLRAAADRPTLESNAFIGVDVGHGTSLSGQYDLADMRDGPRTQRARVSATISLAGRASLLLSVGGVALDGRTSGEGFIGFSFFAGHGTTLGASTQIVGRATRTSVDAQKSLPLGTGLGYRVNAFTADEQRGGSGAIQYQTSFGRYEARYDRVNDVDVPSVSIAGGIVALGGALSLTPPVGESYALIRVPDVPGVTGLSSNQPIARTNRKGNVIVPNLMPYYGNRIGISDRDLPLDYQIGATEKIVAPPYRGGAVVTFPALRMRSIRGTVFAASYGELTLEDGDRLYVSPLGSGGEFELENVPPGRYTATVVSPSKTCRVTLEVPENDQPIVHLGELDCPIAESP